MASHDQEFMHMAKKSSRRRPMPAKPARSALLRGLVNLSAADLQAEIRRRQQATKRLHRRRSTLLARIAAIENEIISAGGSLDAKGPAGGRPRARNTKTLVQALQDALKGRTLSVTEAIEAVQAAGYRSASPSFRTMVNATLLKKDLFKRVDRGRYTAA